MKIDQYLVKTHKEISYACSTIGWADFLTILYKYFGVKTINKYSQNKKEKYGELFYMCGCGDENSVLEEKQLYYLGLL